MTQSEWIFWMVLLKRFLMHDVLFVLHCHAWQQSS